MLLAQMHLALMFFAAKVRKPVVVVWEQRSLRDLIDRETMHQQDTRARQASLVNARQMQEAARELPHGVAIDAAAHLLA